MKRKKKKKTRYGFKCSKINLFFLKKNKSVRVKILIITSFNILINYNYSHTLMSRTNEINLLICMMLKNCIVITEVI